VQREVIFLRTGRRRAAAPAWLLALLLCATIHAALAPARAADPNTLEIVSKTGVHVFSVELAVTEEQRARGLMFRKELSAGKGMLFDFKFEQEAEFSMQNTYIPLDMIFIRADGHIRRIAENAEPLSTKFFLSGGPVRGVLEVIGGTAKKLGIAPGDLVAHPIFSAK
jgi:uncharacterized membrane protein (UPF0127 family)